MSQPVVPGARRPATGTPSARPRRGRPGYVLASVLAVVTDRARALPAPAIERLEYLVRGSVEVLEAESPYVTLLLRVRGNTDVERAALDQRRAFDRFVAQLVAEAVRDGDIRPDVDAMIAARLLFGLVNSVVEWYRPEPPEDTRAVLKARS